MNALGWSMTKEHDVVLPVGMQVKFPDQCVACGASQPNGRKWFWTLNSNPSGNMICWLRVPMCRPCGWTALSGQLLYLAVVLLVFVGVVALLSFFAWEWKDRAAIRIVAAVLAVPAVLALFAWSWIFPPPFSFASDMTLLTFRSQETADAFRQLNQTGAPHPAQSPTRSAKTPKV